MDTDLLHEEPPADGGGGSTPITEYLRQIQRALKRGDATEHTHRNRQYVEGVPESAWTFPIGGYLPAQRWLKDRVSRTLGFEEQTEYQRIVWALMQTKRLMGEIDAAITAHGGWPMR
jgi:hypothetical protein